MSADLLSVSAHTLLTTGIIRTPTRHLRKSMTEICPEPSPRLYVKKYSMSDRKMPYEIRKNKLVSSSHLIGFSLRT